MNFRKTACIYLAVFAAASTLAISPVRSAQAAKESKVLVELYVMSLCPFGVQAENALFPALTAYPDLAELKLGFIGGKAEGPDGNIQFSSLHGQPEVEENIRQLCARDLFPGKWMAYVLERNKDYKAADWRPPAEKAGLDPKTLDACAKGPGIKNYILNLALASEKKAGSSPTIYIDGEPYGGPRTREGFEWSLCSAAKARGARLTASCEKILAGAKPAAGAGSGGDCGAGGAAGQPPAAAQIVFDIKVVNEGGANKICPPTLLPGLKGKYPAAAIKLIDADSAEGRDLITRHNAGALPLYVIDEKVSQDKNFQGLLPLYYTRSGEGYLIRPNPDTYTPCVQLGRKRDPRHIDIFVESLAPRSAQAEADFVRFISEKDIKDLTFSIHYITQEKPGTGTAPKGPGENEVRSASLSEISNAAPAQLLARLGDAELQEDIRQACMFQKLPAADFFAYLGCRNQDLANTRRASACFTGAEAVDRCIKDGEGLALLRKDAKLAAQLGISEGPAMMWENRYGPFSLYEVDWRALLLGGK